MFSYKKPRDLQLNDFRRFTQKSEKIKFLLNFAILAPSTHNIQPWLFKIKENSCEVYSDPKLKIPNADPEGRDLYISIGCAIENLIIASNYFNVFDSVVYNQSEERNFIAEVKFKNLDQENLLNDNFYELVQSILNRINARGLFKNENISNTVVESVRENFLFETSYELEKFDVKYIDNKEKISKIGDLTGEGIRFAYKEKNFRNEMSKWLRNSFTFKKDGLPGYSLRMPFLISFFFSILVKHVNIGKKLAELNKKSIKSAPLICIISSDQENKKFTWLKIGRLSERLMLEFNKRGYNTSIFVAAIEMGDLYKKLQNLIGTSKRPQFLFAIGKIDSKQRFTPRHPVEKKLIF